MDEETCYLIKYLKSRCTLQNFSYPTLKVYFIFKGEDLIGKWFISDTMFSVIKWYDLQQPWGPDHSFET